MSPHGEFKKPSAALPGLTGSFPQVLNQWLRPGLNSSHTRREGFCTPESCQELQGTSIHCFSSSLGCPSARLPIFISGATIDVERTSKSYGGNRWLSPFLFSAKPPETILQVWQEKWWLWVHCLAFWLQEQAHSNFLWPSCTAQPTLFPTLLTPALGR